MNSAGLVSPAQLLITTPEKFSTPFRTPRSGDPESISISRSSQWIAGSVRCRERSRN